MRSRTNTFVRHVNNAARARSAKSSQSSRNNIARAHVSRIRRKEPRRVGVIRRLRTRS